MSSVFILYFNNDDVKVIYKRKCIFSNVLLYPIGINTDWSHYIWLKLVLGLTFSVRHKRTHICRARSDWSRFTCHVIPLLLRTFHRPTAINTHELCPNRSRAEPGLTLWHRASHADLLCKMADLSAVRRELVSTEEWRVFSDGCSFSLWRIWSVFYSKHKRVYQQCECA